jgi:hypothetical protein
MRNALNPALQLATPLACLLAIAASLGPVAREAGRPAGGAPARAAQRIYIDLATGQLREPTAAELAAEGQRAAGGLQATQRLALPAAGAAVDAAGELHLADGTVGVRPARKYLHTIELCRQPDGSFGEHCADAGGGK